MIPFHFVHIRVPCHRPDGHDQLQNVQQQHTKSYFQASIVKCVYCLKRQLMQEDQNMAGVTSEHQYNVQDGDHEIVYHGFSHHVDCASERRDFGVAMSPSRGYDDMASERAIKT